MFEYLKSIGEGRNGINELATNIFNALPIDVNDGYEIHKSLETQSNTDYKENQSATIKYHIIDKDDNDNGIVIDIYPIEVDILRRNQNRSIIDHFNKVNNLINNQYPDLYKTNKELFEELTTLKVKLENLKSDAVLQSEIEDDSYLEYNEGE